MYPDSFKLASKFANLSKDVRISSYRHNPNYDYTYVPIVVYKSTKSTSDLDLKEIKFLAKYTMTIGEFTQQVAAKMGHYPIYLWKGSKKLDESKKIFQLYYSIRSDDGIMYLEFR